MGNLKDGEPGNLEFSLDRARDVIINSFPSSFAILKKHFRSKNLKIDSKGEYVDIVTEADTENESFWREILLKSFPQTQFLGEETASDGYKELARNLNWLWVVDPLDGTVNFSRGNPNFAVSVALIKEGVTKLGVVGIPERNEVYWAQDGVDGTFNTDGDKISGVSEISDLSKATLRCDWVYDPKTREKLAELLKTFGPKVRQILSGGSAVADILDIALGRVDIYFNPGLKPWDVAAACFIVEKAGGKVTDLKGEAWNVFEPNLLLSNGRLHEESLRLVN